MARSSLLTWELPVCSLGRYLLTWESIVSETQSLRAPSQFGSLPFRVWEITNGRKGLMRSGFFQLSQLCITALFVHVSSGEIETDVYWCCVKSRPSRVDFFLQLIYVAYAISNSHLNLNMSLLTPNSHRVTKRRRIHDENQPEQVSSCTSTSLTSTPPPIHFTTPQNTPMMGR